MAKRIAKVGYRLSKKINPRKFESIEVSSMLEVEIEFDSIEELEQKRDQIYRLVRDDVKKRMARKQKQQGAIRAGAAG